MSYIKFKYKNALILLLIILALITVNLASPASPQKRQDPPPGPCKDCTDNCCKNSQECVKNTKDYNAYECVFKKCHGGCHEPCSNTGYTVIAKCLLPPPPPPPPPKEPTKEPPPPPPKEPTKEPPPPPP